MPTVARCHAHSAQCHAVLGQCHAHSLGAQGLVLGFFAYNVLRLRHAAVVPYPIGLFPIGYVQLHPADVWEAFRLVSPPHAAAGAFCLFVCLFGCLFVSLFVCLFASAHRHAACCVLHVGGGVLGTWRVRVAAHVAFAWHAVVSHSGGPDA
jgi:hypothetical protein